jgi:hypothetical protein
MFNPSVTSSMLNGCAWVNGNQSRRLSDCSRTEPSLSSYWNHLNVVATAYTLHHTSKNIVDLWSTTALEKILEANFQ